MPYAYRDKYGILHAVETLNTADEFASGEVVEYQGTCLGGYPAIVLEVFDLGEKGVYLAGNEKSGVKLNECNHNIVNEVNALLRKINL